MVEQAPVDAGDGMFDSPVPDYFEHESPLRAFTSWDATGCYAVGKGWRPSAKHLPVYLDAIERKEGWQLVQVFPDAQARPSTMLFRKVAVSVDPEKEELARADETRLRNDAWLRGNPSAMDCLAKGMEQQKRIAAAILAARPSGSGGHSWVYMAILSGVIGFASGIVAIAASDPVNRWILLGNVTVAACLFCFAISESSKGPIQ